MTLLAVALFFSAGVAVAAEPVAVQPQERNQIQNQTRQTTGRQLMSDEERDEQRSKMRNATTQQEREKIRSEHHEKMEQRAKEQGASIPDNPPLRGQGAVRQGGGMRGGMGGGQGGR